MNPQRSNSPAKVHQPDISLSSSPVDGLACQTNSVERPVVPTGSLPQQDEFVCCSSSATSTLSKRIVHGAQPISNGVTPSAPQAIVGATLAKGTNGVVVSSTPESDSPEHIYASSPSAVLGGRLYGQSAPGKGIFQSVGRNSRIDDLD